MAEVKILKCLLLLFFFINCIVCQQTSDVDALTSWCLDSKHHKTKPGPEGLLHGQCTPWKERSCCRANTTEDLHLDSKSLYNFQYDHCPEKKPLSEACKRHFTQDHCFYECSPNVGPWTVRELRSWRKERYYKVPLCASDCHSWFEACAFDYTCTDNWSTNFDWINSKDCPKGMDTCKQNICVSMCRTFLDIYKTAKNFCQKVWDDAWEFTPDDEPCIRLWFDGSVGNPNDRVALWKAQLISRGGALRTHNMGLIIGCALSVAVQSVLIRWYGTSVR